LVQRDDTARTARLFIPVLRIKYPSIGRGRLLPTASQPASSNQANCSPNTVPEYEEILHRSQNQLRNGREHHTFADRARVTVDRLQLARRSNLPLAESLNGITSRAPRTRRDARGSPCGLSVDAVRRRRRVPNPRMSHTTSTMPQIRMDILDEERNASWALQHESLDQIRFGLP
jgi:hypothetical protein